MCVYIMLFVDELKEKQDFDDILNGIYSYSDNEKLLLIYFAGIFEACGKMICNLEKQYKKTARLRVTFTTNDDVCLKLIQSKFGGHVSTNRLQMGERDAVGFLEVITDFVKSRQIREKIEKFLDVVKTKSNPKSEFLIEVMVNRFNENQTTNSN